MKDLIGILLVMSCIVNFGENYLNNMWHVALYQNDTLYSGEYSSQLGLLFRSNAFIQ